MVADLSRRHFLRVGAVGLGASVSTWFHPLSQIAAAEGKKGRSCILLWLNGGPATIDLWDCKPGHENGGPVKAISTNAPGLQISEYLPNLAKWGKDLCVVRNLSTREGDHERAVYLMRTGVVPNPSLQYPSLGSLLSKELGQPETDLPNFVSVGSNRFFGINSSQSGFLGPKYDPLIVGGGFFRPSGEQLENALKVENVDLPKGVDASRAAQRLEMLREMQNDFANGRPGTITNSHGQAYESATRLMLSGAGKAFDLKEEKDKLREQYGKTIFGQGCLLARRLVERGVVFVEVTLDGWDTHNNNFDEVKKLGGELDKGWSALMTDLKDRGLLETTTIICAGEFGRTPRINPRGGRDHFPGAWSAVLAGAGVKGGQAIGKTSADGSTVEGKKTNTADFLATLCKALKIDPTKQNQSNIGRPIRLVDNGEAISEALA